MIEEEIPASPRLSTQQKRRKADRSRLVTKKRKQEDSIENIIFDNDNKEVDYHERVKNCIPTMSKMALRDRRTIHHPLSIVQQNRKDSKPSSRREMLANYILMEDLEREGKVCLNSNQNCRSVNSTSFTSDNFITVTELIASQKLRLNEKSVEHTNNSVPDTQFNVPMQSQFDVTPSQMTKIDDEVKKTLSVNQRLSSYVKFKENNEKRSMNDDVKECDEKKINLKSNKQDKRNMESYSTSITCVNTNYLDTMGTITKIQLDKALASRKRRSSIVQSIIDDFSIVSDDTPSPVKISLNERISSPKFVVLKPIKKTYGRNSRRVAAFIPSPTGSSCCALELGADCIENMLSTCDPGRNDEEIDLNESVHVIDNIHNLSKFYSQSQSYENKSIENDVKEFEFSLVGTKPMKTITLSDRLDEFQFDFDDGIWDNDDNSRKYCSVSGGTNSEPELNQFFQDDDDIFAEIKTQYNGSNVNYQLNSFMASATPSSHPLQGTIDQPRCGAEFDGSHNLIGLPKVKFGTTPLLHPTFSVVDYGKFDGFRKATGAKINISEIAALKIKNIFKEVELDYASEIAKTEFNVKQSNISTSVSSSLATSSTDRDKKIPNATTSVNTNPTFASFSTGRGCLIPVPAASLTKMSRIFENVISEEETKIADKWVGDNELDYVNKVDNCNRLQSATCSSAAKSTTCFENVVTEPGRSEEYCISAPISKKTTKNVFEGITLACESENAQQNEDFAVTKVSPKPVEFKQSYTNPMPLFTTARGYQIPLPTVTSKSSNVFQGMVIPAEDLKDMDTWFNEKTTDNENANSTSAMFTTGKSLTSAGASVFEEIITDRQNSADLFREVTNSLNYSLREVNQEAKNTSSDETYSKSSPKIAKQSPSRRPPSLRSSELLKFDSKSLKENVKIHSNSLFKCNEISVENIQTPKSSHNIFVTPEINSKTFTQEIRESGELCIQDEQMSIVNSSSVNLSAGFRLAFSSIAGSSTTIPKYANNRSKVRPTRLAERFDDIAGQNYFESSDIHTINSKVPEDIVAARKVAFEEQYRSIKQKTNISPTPGTLYIKKLISTKSTWRDFIDNSRPRNGIPETASKLAENVLRLNSENVKNFKFNASDYYCNEFCRENISGLLLNDDMVVIMDGNSQVGLTEISNAFLSCPSVDPKLVHDKWIENSFRWIMIKLAGMERSFPDRFGGKVLTLENVMLQLKYRYDREIDSAIRSAIHKICEMDDIAALRMILFVARIEYIENGKCEVELSDGWYSLFSTLDIEMAKAVKTGKIKVGTKLITQGAELVGLESGCYPLDINNNVRLKIHANSTRRVKWDSKLGYSKNSKPFTINLGSALRDGGRISQLKVWILRVYPIVYYHSENKSIHSEKVEKRRSANEEQDKLSIVEKLFSQVSKEYEEEEKAACSQLCLKLNLKEIEISTLTDPAILHQLLEEDNDPDYIEYKMTECQKEMVVSYRERLNFAKNDTINSRVKEKLSSINKLRRKTTSLLKFKIMDNQSNDKTACVTIWNPRKDMFSKIQEGTCHEMSNACVRGINSNELQIYAGKSTYFKEINAGFQMPDLYRRQYTSISEMLSVNQPMFNELDTAGIVVHVDDFIPTKLQSVYIADHQQNIMCLNFYNGLKEHAYDDVVQPKRILAIKNLQWQAIRNIKRMPCCIATEYTIFTENPKCSEFVAAISNFKKKFETTDMNDFVEECTEKISEMKYAKSIFSSTPVRTSSVQFADISLPRTPDELSHHYSHSPLSNKSRIERLSRYGEPAPTPPLHIKSLKKGFKPPALNQE